MHMRVDPPLIRVFENNLLLKVDNPRPLLINHRKLRPARGYILGPGHVR